jgi:UDP-N-acetylmuramoylalanine-D-glutamate ligase
MWVNDSKATTVDATAVGIKGIAGRQAVVLIGGVAKVLLLKFY